MGSGCSPRSKRNIKHIRVQGGATNQNKILMHDGVQGEAPPKEEIRGKDPKKTGSGWSPAKPQGPVPSLPQRTESNTQPLRGVGEV